MIKQLVDWFRNPEPITDGWLAVCLPFTKDHEGCRLTAYWDPYGQVWTIGYGATGQHITEGTKWTQAQADHDLMARLSLIGDELDEAVKVPLTDNQKAALGDFTYNEGIGTFLKSSVLVQLNAGNARVAMERLLLYDKAGGRIVGALDTRRMDEVHLFET